MVELVEVIKMEIKHPEIINKVIELRKGLGYSKQEALNMVFGNTGANILTACMESLDKILDELNQSTGQF